MGFITFLQIRHARLTWLSSMLVLLLQRTPVVRLFAQVNPGVVFRSGQVLRALVPATIVTGGVNTLTGATNFTASPSSPASATADTPFSMAFAVTGAPSTPNSYSINGPLPAGLSVPGATVNGTNRTLNATTGTIFGTPTESGSFSVSIRAYAKPDLGGEKGPIYTYTIDVTGAAMSPPSFGTQPTTQTVTAGGTATFTVSVTGSPTPTLQWRKNGTNLPGKTNATLTLSNVSSADAGNYDCRAINSAGTATSNVATLTVNAAATAPSFTTQPAAQSAAAGGTATFTVAVTGSPTPTLQWRKDGTNLAGQTGTTLTITNAGSANEGSYDCVATNTAGSTTSTTATFTVNAAAIAPLFTAQPSSQTVAAGGTATFSVALNGSPTPSLQWRKDGSDLAGETSGTLTIFNVSSANAGDYDCVASNSAGSATSNPATLTIAASATPTIAVQPVSMTSLVGTGSFFSVQATGGGLTYQWFRNGTPIAGATDPTLYVADVQTANAGSYTVVVTNGSGTQAVSDAANLNVVTSGSARLINMSTRAGIGMGVNNVIPGFVIEGNVSLSLLIRAVGPRLAVFDVPEVLADPVMTLFTGSTPIAQNDDWDRDQNHDAVAAAITTTGAFSLPAGSLDSALLVALNPGAYTVHVAGKNGATGTALVELYVADGLDSIGPNQLVNLSARVGIGIASDRMIAGFFVRGNNSLSLLVRAIGPRLAELGVDPAVADPEFTVYSGSVPIASNDNWGQSQNPSELAAAMAATGALSLAPSSADAASLVSLGPGGYTVHVTGNNGSTGEALVELYLVDAIAPPVSVPPSFTTQPQSQTVDHEDNVTFTVAVNGTPTPTLQWRKDGANLTGQTGTSLILTKVDQEKNGGNYDCVATNTAGTALSNIATLTVTDDN